MSAPISPSSAMAPSSNGFGSASSGSTGSGSTAPAQGRSLQSARAGLADQVARMGGMTEAMMLAALDAVARRDTVGAQGVIERLHSLCAMQDELEQSVVRMLALWQPLAEDVRGAIAALKISVHLERMGELARNVAERTLALNQEDPTRFTRSVDRMGRLVIGHLSEALDAYARRDAERARAAVLRDDEVDEHYNSILRELLTYMMEDPRAIGVCAHLLFVAKNIERMGDHATHVARLAHGAATGRELDRRAPSSDKHPSTD